MLLDDVVTKREAAELAHVSFHTISAWLTQKRLRRIKAGSRTLVLRSDLEKLLRIQEVDDDAA